MDNRDRDRDSSMGTTNIISKNLKDFKKIIIGIDSKVDNVKRIEYIQTEITKLILENNVYKKIYPDDRVPENVGIIINNNNHKIKKFKEERDFIYKDTREQLRNNILKNYSPTCDKNESS